MSAVTTGNGGPYSAESPLGAHAPTLQRTGRTLPFGDERHLQAHQWLVDEAYLLDARSPSCTPPKTARLRAPSP